jgi:hypothetical protein
VTDVQRLLDLDLDFFVQPVVTWVRADAPRPDPDTHQVALGDETALRSIAVDTADPHQAAIQYLRERLGLVEPLPGVAVDHHGKVFSIWRRMIASGELRIPFHVTHVDAHADFGFGQTSYKHVFEALRRPPAGRDAYSQAVLTDGDYLVHAVACGWISSLTYVFCPGGGVDIDGWYFENFGRPNWYQGATGTLRLAPLDDLTRESAAAPVRHPPQQYHEPRVPFEGIPQSKYRTLDPFDFVFLARSPAFTPVTADLLFDAIAATLIEPLSAT